MKTITLRTIFLLLIGFWVLTGTREIHAFQIKEGRGKVVLLAKLPRNYSFIREAPSSFEASSTAPEIVNFPSPLPHRFDPSSGRYTLPFTARPGKTTVKIKAKLYYCEKKSKMCFQKIHETQFTFDIDPQKGPTTVFYVWNITPDNSN